MKPSPSEQFALLLLGVTDDGATVYIDVQRDGLEHWAFKVCRDAPISEAEFAAHLPRVGSLLERYGKEELYRIFVGMTSKGVPFEKVLELMESVTVTIYKGPDDPGRELYPRRAP